MYKATIDSDTHLAILEPRHAKELFELIDQNRDHLGKWLSFPEKTNQVEDTVKFIERSLKRLSEHNG